MSIAAPRRVSFEHRFATEFSEMAVPWQAEEAPDPQLLVLNESLATELGLDPHWLRTPEGVRLLLGLDLPSGATPVAQAYAGHQFGGYSPRLGDGRALLLGELTDSAGRLQDVHLKGSGRTPFARGGDGLAAVGPMLREYAVSEAMHALGIPTTRSLAVVATGRRVRRETMLPGAVLTRVASSHLRVGSFQYARATGDLDLLRRLTDHAIGRHHPDAAEADNPSLALFRAVVADQASLVAQWMLVGFVHGVMNTDNMTISGQTIDYGPCAFMEAFDPATVYSSIDQGGRYAYGNQPVVAQWNLARLAESLLPFLHEDETQAVEVAKETLEQFAVQYSSAWSAGIRAKLGLPEGRDEGSEGGRDERRDKGGDEGRDEASDDETVRTLVSELLTLLQQDRVDHTSFFRNLAPAARGDAEPVRDMFLHREDWDAWLRSWRALSPDAAVMDRVNPAYIPRNHLVEEALAAGTDGDAEPFEQLLDAVTDPFHERTGLERYAESAPEDFGAYRTYCGT